MLEDENIFAGHVTKLCRWTFG